MNANLSRACTECAKTVSASSSAIVCRVTEVNCASLSTMNATRRRASTTAPARTSSPATGATAARATQAVAVRSR